MRFFLKIVLLAALPLGGYWLCKKWERPTEEENTTSQSPPSLSRKFGRRVADAKQGGEGARAQIIEELSNIDGVTPRVAENLVAKGIKSKEALMELTEEELRAVKGIGPKRAEKILSL